MATQAQGGVRPAWGQGDGHRDNPTGDVVDGRKTVANPAVQITAFNSEHSTKEGRDAPVHSSTGIDQLSARGFANDSHRLPPVPVAAFNPTPRPVRTVPVGWGMSSSPSPHDPKVGGQVLGEAVPCGGLYPHPECGD